jgi:hypothetical protein
VSLAGLIWGIKLKCKSPNYNLDNHLAAVEIVIGFLKCKSIPYPSFLNWVMTKDHCDYLRFIVKLYAVKMKWLFWNIFISDEKKSRNMLHFILLPNAIDFIFLSSLRHTKIHFLRPNVGPLDQNLQGRSLKIRLKQGSRWFLSSHFGKCCTVSLMA